MKILSFLLFILFLVPSISSELYADPWKCESGNCRNKNKSNGLWGEIKNTIGLDEEYESEALKGLNKDVKRYKNELNQLLNVERELKNIENELEAEGFEDFAPAFQMIEKDIKGELKELENEEDEKEIRGRIKELEKELEEKKKKLKEAQKDLNQEVKELDKKYGEKKRELEKECDERMRELQKEYNEEKKDITDEYQEEMEEAVEDSWFNF